MQKIIPHLWFDNKAKEAANFYVSAFGNDSKVTNAFVLRDTPSGDCDVLTVSLCGLEMVLFSAGPYFKLNPSISFMVNFDPSVDKDARKNIDALWRKFADGGKPLMPIDTYPFSERYGWIEDKYGVNWQLILTKPEGEPRPKIMPSLMFTGDNTGKADDAINFYVSLFKNAKRGMTAPYPPGASPEPAAKLMFAEFMLEGQWFTAMDSGHMHNFTFNEALSLLIPCDTQEEIDAFTKKLSAVPEAEQCGWVKDKYGVSWQISPSNWTEMMGSPDEEAVARVTKAFMSMKKFDLQALKNAYDGK